MADQNAVFATSNPMQISFILDAIIQLRPESIVDIGCGSGKYGVLLREYLPKARIDGVEGFSPYVTEVHRTIYDNIFETNALDFAAQMTRGYNLAIMIDMFEHLTPADGERLLTLLRTRTGSILISVPVCHPTQEAIHGNALQEHRAQYDAAILRRLGFGQIFRISGSYIALLGPMTIRLRGKALKCAVTALLPEWANRALAPFSRKFHQ
ncbi:MAG TPA: methyltransferase domain-containing protein [Verrucomicrobiae bacterium]|nr:methyltransferase domain-containing protein [Verrucomicrobiae bacterium]